MEEKVMHIKLILSISGSFLSELLGGTDKLLVLILHLVVIDFLLGILCSIKKKEFSSAVARWGFTSKLFYFVIIALCYLIDGVVGDDCFIRNIAIVWFSICESASILENAAKLGVPLPNGLVDVLVQAKNGINIRIIDVVKKLIQENINSDGSEEKRGNKNE